METLPSPAPLSDLRTLLLGGERDPLPDILADLAPVLPEAVLDDALNAVSSIGFMGRTARQRALVQLLVRAPEPLRNVWMERTLVYLPQLTQHLPDVLLPQALEVLRGMTDTYDQEDRARALAALVRRLPEPEGDEVVAGEALRVTEERPWDWERRLAALAPGLRGTAAQEVAPRLIGAAREMDAPSNRAQVLVRLLPFLPVEGRGQGLDEALAAARAAEDPSLLAALRPRVDAPLQETLLKEALALARERPDPVEKAEALAAIADQVDADERAPLRSEVQALDLSDALTGHIYRWFDPDPRGEPPLLLTYLSEEQHAQVLGAIADLSWEEERASMLIEFIPYLPVSLLPQVLEGLTAFDESAPRAQVLRALIPALPGDLLTDALAVAMGLEDERWRLWALDRLVERRPELARDPAVREQAPLFRGRVQILLDQIDHDERIEVLTELIDAIWDRFGGSEAAAAPPDEGAGGEPRSEGESPVEGSPPEASPPAPAAPESTPPRESAGGRGEPPTTSVPPPKGQAQPEEQPEKEDTADSEEQADVVSTGFADPRRPAMPVSRHVPLVRGRSYYFWLEVGAPVAGAIDVEPTEVPRELLPEEARLKVALFGFEEEIQLTPGADVGEIQLEPDGSARVTRPVARPDQLEDHDQLVPADLLERRLFFPVRLPARSGTFRLRCNLYYEHVLVQSHLVQVTAAPWPLQRASQYGVGLLEAIADRLGRTGRLAQRLRWKLQTRVDYTLSNTLRPERLAGLEPHRLSILLNDNGDGTHGFRFFGSDDQTEFKQDAALTGQELQNLIDQARGAMRQAAWGDAGPWSDQPYRYEGPAGEAQLRGDLVRLARWGYRFYDALIGRLAAGRSTDRLAIRTAVKDLQRLMRTPGYIQVASKDAAQHVVPVALFYDQALDSALPTEQYQLCPAFLEAFRADRSLLTSACFQGHCPSRDADDVVCPSGFWGFRHNIGLPVTIGGSLRDLATEITYEEAPQLTVAVSTDRDFVMRPAHEQALQVLKQDLGWHYADTRDEALDLMRTTPSHLLYFYCHGGLLNDLPYLQIGSLDEHGYITRDTLRSKDVFWTAPQPLVFLNGCHTTAVEPEQALNLVTGFVETSNAAGVIGTEITVFEPLACAFAEECLRHFIGGVSIGEAVRRARLKLLQEGNPLGLVYIPFVIASLTMMET